MADGVWNLDPPPGFQGLHPEKQVAVYYRHLPHWRQDGATYFVTFRLADALPQSKLRELEVLKRGWEFRGIEQREELARLTVQRVEEWLDQGLGGCRLKHPPVSRQVVAGLHHFDGDRYELGCYVVMPNHVHAVLRPLHPPEDPLERVLQSRKRQMSRDINRTLGRTGPVWQEESFDRIVRDEDHLYRCIQYIGRNPQRAGLPPDICPRWIRPPWFEAGWGFEVR